MVTTATNSITLAVGASSPAATLACTANPLAATNGVATFAGCKITGKAGTTYTLTAAATGFTTITSQRLHHHLRHGHPAGLHHPARRRRRRAAPGAPSRRSPSRTSRATWSPTRPPRSPWPSAPRPAGATLACTTNPLTADQRGGHLRRLQDHRQDRPTYTLTARPAGSRPSPATPSPSPSVPPPRWSSPPSPAAGQRRRLGPPSLHRHDRGRGGNTVTTGANSTDPLSFTQTGRHRLGDLRRRRARRSAGGHRRGHRQPRRLGHRQGGRHRQRRRPPGSSTLSFTITFGTATQLVLSGPTASRANGATLDLHRPPIEDAAGNTVTSGADSTDSITFSPDGAGPGLGDLRHASATAAGVRHRRGHRQPRRLQDHRQGERHRQRRRPPA